MRVSRPTDVLAFSFPVLCSSTKAAGGQSPNALRRRMIVMLRGTSPVSAMHLPAKKTISHSDTRLNHQVDRSSSVYGVQFSGVLAA
jgi:hypothetical protein